MKYKEMLRKKGGKNSDGASEKTDQAGAVEQEDEDPCDVLTTHSDAWILDSGCTYHMCWLSIYKLYDGGSVLMGNNTVCKTIGIGNIYMRMFDGHV